MLKVNLSDLLKENKLKKINRDLLQAKECLNAATHDLATAEKLVGEDNDWALVIAYNAMLQSARALMFAEGFTTVGEAHHKIVVDYAEVKLGSKFREKIDLFDSLRKKRNQAVYEKRGFVTEFEAKHAIKTAKEFVEIVKQKLG